MTLYRKMMNFSSLCSFSIRRFSWVKNLKGALAAEQTSCFPINLFGRPNSALEVFVYRKEKKKTTDKVCEWLADNFGAELCDC